MAEITPEAVRELARDLYGACEKAVRERGGEVAPWDEIVQCGEHGDCTLALAGWLAAAREALRQASERGQELAGVRERAEFYEAERDRERLAAEHHRTACVELEAELADVRGHVRTLAEVEASAIAAERARIRAAAGDLKVTLFRPGNGPAQAQALDVVPLEGMLGLLAGAGPEAPGHAEEASVKLGRIREVAESWTEADEWGEPTQEMRTEAECGREILAIIDGDRSGT